MKKINLSIASLCICFGSIAQTPQIILKLINTSVNTKFLLLNIKGLAKTAVSKSLVLMDKDLKNFNTIDQPNKFTNRVKCEFCSGKNFIEFRRIFVCDFED